MIILALSVAIAILLYFLARDEQKHRQSSDPWNYLKPRRDRTLVVALLIVAATSLAIEIHLLRFLRDLFEVVVEHWRESAVGLSAALLAVVPAIMIYVEIRDRIAERSLRPVGPSSLRHRRDTVVTRFERRVATLMALGYGRTEAESAALTQMKRDLNRSSAPPHNLGSRH